MGRVEGGVRTEWEGGRERGNKNRSLRERKIDFKNTPSKFFHLVTRIKRRKKPWGKAFRGEVSSDLLLPYFLQCPQAIRGRRKKKKGSTPKEKRGRGAMHQWPMLKSLPGFRPKTLAGEASGEGGTSRKEERIIHLRYGPKLMASGPPRRSTISLQKKKKTGGEG